MSPSVHDENVLHFLRDLPLSLAPEHDIRGRTLFDEGGSVIGTVREFVVSHDSERVIFVEVETRTLMGKRKSLVAVDQIIVRSPDRLGIRGSSSTGEETPWKCPDLLKDETRAHFSHVL